MKKLIERRKMAGILLIYDLLGIQLASAMAILTRFEFLPSMVEPTFVNTILHYALINTGCTICIFTIYRLYAILWQFASMMDFFCIVKAVLLASVLQLIGMHMLNFPIARSYFVLYIGWLGLISACPRILIRILSGGKKIPLQHFNKEPITVMLIGAGAAGNMILNEIQNSQFIDKQIVCMIDDDPSKQGTYLHKVPVVGGRQQIKRCVIQFGIEEIILAIPTLPAKDRKEILNICKETGCMMSILPGLYQLINKDIRVSMLRKVEIDDLLGREPIQADLKPVMDYVTERVVLVTGGGGSIGSELCRQVSSYHPQSLIIIDNYENNAYSIQMELKHNYPELDVKVLIVSVQNERRIHNIFEHYHPDLVFHAAAHKHVPLMEDSPCDAIRNNVFGTLNVAKAAGDCGVKRMVLISTDKAVRPTNIMGASKRICEMLVQTINKYYATEYVAVRFGNVLGSNGSVVPLFRKQITEGGPVTVTHPDIIRYFMTIPEAVGLVLEAGVYAKGGEIFILDMGEPVRILDLAENMIRLSGLIPGEDIEIKFTGLRPGEKLYEELLINEENKRETENKRIFIGQPIPLDEDAFLNLLIELKKAAYSEDREIRRLVKKIVPEYNYVIEG